MATYITAIDVMDSQLQTLVTSFYLSEVDKYMQDLAVRRGLLVTQMLPVLAFTAKRLAIAYLCMIISRDKIGINVQANGYGVDIDIYQVKWKTWTREFENLEPLVTAEILSGDADTPPEFANVGIPLFRG